MPHSQLIEAARTVDTIARCSARKLAAALYRKRCELIDSFQSGWKNEDMGEPLPVIADIPTETPGLGFDEYVEAMVDAVRGGHPAQFTIGIYGPWGSGKSSILRAMQLRLAASEDVTPVFFDAWRYEQSEHIIVPLLHEIHRALEESGHVEVAGQLLKALRAVVAGLNFKLLKVSDVLDAWRQEELTRLDEAFSRPFEELRALPAALGDTRIAVLIDDLDRCSDRNVVAVLEAINLIMDVPGMIFVLALDYDILVKAIERKYAHVSGDAFIEKLVQIPFRVPPLTIYNRRSLEELIPEWSQHVGDLPDHFSDRVIDIAILGLRGNPRQIKRLLNSFLVVQRIMQARGLPVDHLLLVTVIGLQLRWPAANHLLHEAVRDAMDDPGVDPLGVVRGDESNVELTRYVDRFIGQDGGAPEGLWRMLQLTAVVSPEAEPEVDPFGMSAPPESG